MSHAVLRIGHSACVDEHGDDNHPIAHERDQRDQFVLALFCSYVLAGEEGPASIARVANDLGVAYSRIEQILRSVSSKIVRRGLGER